MQGTGQSIEFLDSQIRALKQQGLSQRSIAKDLGIARSTLGLLS